MLHQSNDVMTMIDVYLAVVKLKGAMPFKWALSPSLQDKDNSKVFKSFSQLEGHFFILKKCNVF